MKIYTRTGDLGETALVGGPRVGKDMARIEVLGQIDELSAVVGMARAERLPDELDGILERVQRDLLMLGAQLSTFDSEKSKPHALDRAAVTAIEADIDRLSAELPPLDSFLLPGGVRAAAVLHLARTVCRRVERRFVTLIRQSEQRPSLDPLAYLNRLSDLLFVLARTVDKR